MHMEYGRYPKTPRPVIFSWSNTHGITVLSNAVNYVNIILLVDTPRTGTPEKDAIETSEEEKLLKLPKIRKTSKVLSN